MAVVSDRVAMGFRLVWPWVSNWVIVDFRLALGGFKSALGGWVGGCRSAWLFGVSSCGFLVGMGLWVLLVVGIGFDGFCSPTLSPASLSHALMVMGRGLWSSHADEDSDLWSEVFSLFFCYEIDFWMDTDCGSGGGWFWF